MARDTREYRVRDRKEGLGGGRKRDKYIPGDRMDDVSVWYGCAEMR